VQLSIPLQPSLSVSRACGGSSEADLARIKGMPFLLWAVTYWPNLTRLSTIFRWYGTLRESFLSKSLLLAEYRVPESELILILGQAAE